MYQEADYEASTSGIPIEFIPYKSALYFEWSASNYLLGNSTEVVEIFERSAAEDSDIEPFAIIIYAASLIEIGRRIDAEAVVDEALDRFDDPDVVGALRSVLE